MKIKMFTITIVFLALLVYSSGILRANNSSISINDLNNNVISAHGKISFVANNIDDLIDNSELIIVAKVTNRQTEFTFGEVDFVKTQIEVNNVLKGDTSIQEITLLQTLIAEDPVVEKDSNVLLFLEKYKGPVIDNAYVSKGLYQGHYKLKNDIIIPSKDIGLSVTKDIQKIENLINLKNKIATRK